MIRPFSTALLVVTTSCLPSPEHAVPPVASPAAQPDPPPSSSSVHVEQAPALRARSAEELYRQQVGPERADAAALLVELMALQR